jgi:hypothetical protein
MPANEKNNRGPLRQAQDRHAPLLQDSRRALRDLPVNMPKYLASWRAAVESRACPGCNGMMRGVYSEQSTTRHEST